MVVYFKGQSLEYIALKEPESTVINIFKVGKLQAMGFKSSDFQIEECNELSK